LRHVNYKKLTRTVPITMVIKHPSPDKDHKKFVNCFSCLNFDYNT
jgi:hypothetical protein